MGGGVIFNGTFSVDDTTNVIQHFYDIKNPHVDILLPVTNNNNYDYDADNKFINMNFTEVGTNIQPVIPYINTNYGYPSRLNLWYGYRGIMFYQIISFKPTLNDVYDWTDIYNPYNTFAFTFDKIDKIVSPGPLNANMGVISATIF